jgi:hypothetical protein
MHTGEFIKIAFPELIKATDDPTAPIKLQEAHKFATAVGKMLANNADQARVETFTQSLTRKWERSNLNAIAAEPEFVIALAALFATSIERYVRNVATKGGKLAHRKDRRHRP